MAKYYVTEPPHQEEIENICFISGSRRPSTEKLINMEEGQHQQQQVRQQDTELHDQTASQPPPIESRGCTESSMDRANEEEKNPANAILDQVSEMVGAVAIKTVYLIDEDLDEDTKYILRRALHLYPTATTPFILIWNDKAEIFLMKPSRRVSREKTQKRQKRKSTITSSAQHVSLPGQATIQDNLELRLELQKLLHQKYKCLCLKMLVGIKDHMIDLKWIDKYVDGNIPILLVDDRSDASTAFQSVFRAIKTGGKELNSRKQEFRKACQKFELEHGGFEELYKAVKLNALKAHACKLPKQNSLREFTANIRIAMCNEITQSTTFLMDSSEEIARSLASDSRYSMGSKIIVFPNMVKQRQNQELNVDVFRQYKEHFTKLERNLGDSKKVILSEELLSPTRVQRVPDRISVLTCNGENVDCDGQALYEAVKDTMSIENIKKCCALVSEYSDKELKELSPVLKFHCALKRCKHKAAEEVLKTNALDVYPYIYFNIFNHWKDTGWHRKTKVTEYFKIIDEYSKSDTNGDKSGSTSPVGHGMHDNKTTKDGIGEKINNAVFKLSNNMVAKLFEDDGRPNIKVANPIQALIVNRLLCMEVEFVKVLWLHDKKNSLTNALLLRLLVEGILNEGIFKDRHSTDVIHKFKKYIDDTMIQLLRISEHCYQDHYNNPILSQSPIFKNRRLIDIAGEFECESFFTQTIAKRIVAYEWRLRTPPLEFAEPSDPQTTSEPKLLEPPVAQVTSPSENEGATYRPRKKTMRKLEICPRSKLYVHMVMYVLCYISVSWLTLRITAWESHVLRPITFILVTALLLDEIRQALGKRGKISVCLKRWSSDPWNILDSITLLLYYIGVSLDFAGSSDARYLLAILTFIWCLKFYQFLRAFKSVGTYIIMVQKMLPHLWSFSLVALVALIAYGVFMTSIMFPSHNFGSWNTLLFMLIRPYLLLFAETGIDGYEFSKSTTLFNTKKIPTAYEVVTVFGMCVFLLFGGILLLNLLIAIFSGVYEEVKDKSLRLWVINDFQLLKEFVAKPSLPIPFSALQNLQFIINRITKGEEDIPLEDKDRVEMEKQQERVMNKFMERREKQQQPIDIIKEVREQKELISLLLEELKVKPYYNIKANSERRKFKSGIPSYAKKIDVIFNLMQLKYVENK